MSKTKSAEKKPKSDESQAEWNKKLRVLVNASLQGMQSHKVENPNWGKEEAKLDILTMFQTMDQSDWNP